MGFSKVCVNKAQEPPAFLKALSAFYDRVRPEQKAESVHYFHLVPSFPTSSSADSSDAAATAAAAVPSWNAFGLPAEKLFFIEALSSPAAATSSEAASARVRFLSLLDLASEAGCETALLCLDRHSPTLKDQLQAYTYLGFSAVEPREADRICGDNSAIVLRRRL
jgi:hypothetical protein